MRVFSRLFAGSAGLAMVVGAAVPAAAQYNQYPNQYGSPNVIGSVINSVLGSGRYGAYGQGQDRVAVDQCARAAEARVSGDFRAGRYGAYGQGYNNQGYGNQGYPVPRYGNQAFGQARVVGITGVERKSNGLKVSGLIESGMGHRDGYGAQGYDPRYGNPSYGNPSYGNPAYGNNAYSAEAADLRFSCRVDYTGRVSNVDIKRNNGRRI